jgi:hypothetical protein
MARWWRSGRATFSASAATPATRSHWDPTAGTGRSLGAHPVRSHASAAGTGDARASLGGGSWGEWPRSFGQGSRAPRTRLSRGRGGDPPAACPGQRHCRPAGSVSAALRSRNKVLRTDHQKFCGSAEAAAVRLRKGEAHSSAQPTLPWACARESAPTWIRVCARGHSSSCRSGCSAPRLSRPSRFDAAPP